MRTTTGLALTGLCLFALSTAGCGGGDADAAPSLAPAAVTGPPTPMSAATGPAVLRQDGPVEYTAAQTPATPMTAGRGGTFTARFTALRPGETWIRLHYRRPWEKPARLAPANSFTAHVMVS